nr:probable cysteine protease RD19D [Coffea arabica]
MQKASIEDCSYMENLLDEEFLNYLQGFEENWLTILPNAIRPVRNQGNIGACAAFGTTDATSALHVINGGESVTLSAQEFVDHLHDRIGDRADIPVNEGAVLPPTTIDDAFTMMEVFGVFEENVYPYTGVKAQVRTIPPEAMNRGRKMFIKSYVPISRRKPLKAIRALRRQPIVGIMRAPKYFKKFRGPGTYYRGLRLKFERAP